MHFLTLPCMLWTQLNLCYSHRARRDQDSHSYKIPSKITVFNI
jgi:hypothetical protein